MCDIMQWAIDKGKNEGQTKLVLLWNWLQNSGRGDEAIEMMSPSSDDLRKALFEEYESSIQEK